MKNTCKIILYLLCIIFLCYGCSKKASIEKYYVVYSPYSYAANLLISNNRGLIREEGNDISLEIIEDEMTKERVLLKSSTTIPITPVGGYWKWEPNTVTMKSKYKYFDFNTFEEYKIDDNYRIDSVFNGYAIIPTFELKNEEKERLIKELDESGSAYTRDIDLFDTYESNYYKSYEKVYNLNDNTFKKLAKTLTSIEIKNNEVIGIFRDNNYKDTYYHFDNDFNFIKELALPEYEKLKKDVDDQYDNVRFEFNTIDCGICKSIIDNGYCFVVDGKNRQITKKYNCKFLSAENRTNDEQSIEDLIFRRDENDQYIYFNIKLSDDGTYKENVIYKGDENGIVIGKNNCYAIIVGNEATIYNSRTDAPFGKVDYMVKNTNCEDGYLSNSLPGNFDYSNNEDMYLRDFILLDNFVYGKYVPKVYLNLFFEKNFLPFTLIGKDFSHDYVTLNTHSDTTILHGQYSILRNRNTGKTYLLDNKSLKLTEFDDNYKNMEKLSIGDTVFYELKKRDYIHSDLYDEKFNLIDTNLTHVKKYKNYILYQKDSWTYVIDKNNKKVFSIGSTDLDIEFFGDDKLVCTMRGSGAEIKTIIYCLQSGKEKEIPVLARYIRGLGDDYYYYSSNDKKTVVLNKNGNIVKIFNNEYEYESIIKPNNDIYNKTYFLTSDFDEKVNVILNEKFDEIATVDDDFVALMYDECYSYVSGGVFYVRDYDNFIIYKENIDKFGYGRPSYHFFDLDANE